MKGIILAGGSGTRLYPVTRTVSKQLLPVYDKPMIYYPLSVLMLAGIRDILIISTPVDLPRFRDLLGSGEQLGLRLDYQEQIRPDGIAQAFVLGTKFINNEPAALVLGEKAGALTRGALVFGYPVKDPERYGVVVFDKDRRVVDIEEKPRQPKSRYAVPGLYFYDARVAAFAAALKPSARGELEITDLNRCYLAAGDLHVQLFGRGIAWLDTGTHESLLQASNFVQVVQERQSFKIACLEEIAYRKGYISRDQLKAQGREMEKNEYGQYLLQLAEEA